MKKTSKLAPATELARQAVIYARVSSKEQEKEGFSIPAQLKLLKEYAAANGFAVWLEIGRRSLQIRVISSSAVLTSAREA
jgi:predicted site-specific integrase-resolvase